MNRKAERLDSLYDTLHTIHKKYFTDWRFGQFISNFMNWCIQTQRCGDIFFPEDNKWELWIKEYVNEMYEDVNIEIEEQKCDCFREQYGKTVCFGTREMEECDCGGDRNKCNFY